MMGQALTAMELPVLCSCSLHFSCSLGEKVLGMERLARPSERPFGPLVSATVQQRCQGRGPCYTPLAVRGCPLTWMTLSAVKSTTSPCCTAPYDLPLTMSCLPSVVAESFSLR